MQSNFGEKRLTKFFNDEFLGILAPKMRRLGFPIKGREKKLYGKKFDIWFHKKHVGFVIIESEVVGWRDYYNLTKLREIGILRWKWPKIAFFQVFSPAYSRGKPRIKEKRFCINLGKRLNVRYKNFRYVPLEMQIEPDRFQKMVDYFQDSKYAAKQYYGGELRKEMRRLGRAITKNVQNSFPPVSEPISRKHDS